MKILVVEDEHMVASALKKGLEQENFTVDLAYDGELGYDMGESGGYDLVILDLMLPIMDGLSVCQKLREDGIHVPILILTAKGEIGDKVTGLGQGADDYLVKPFAFEELLARVRALLRRPAKQLTDRLKIGSLVIDKESFQVTRAGQDIVLSRREFSLLEYLARNAGSVISKNQIIAHVWEYDTDILENTVEVNIRNLRKKLGSPDPIKTLRGFGYKLLTTNH